MHIRRAGPEDADGFAAVIAAVAEEGDYILTEPPVDTAGLVQGIRAALVSAEGDALWVAEADGRVVGSLGLHPTNADGVFSLGMSLLPEARGAGGGRRLLDAALAHARRVGLHKVELEVFPDNGRAVALYASSGFLVEGLLRSHYPRRNGTRRDVLLMAAFLEAPRGG